MPRSSRLSRNRAKSSKTGERKQTEIITGVNMTDSRNRAKSSKTGESFRINDSHMRTLKRSRNRAKSSKTGESPGMRKTYKRQAGKVVIEPNLRRPERE